MTSSYAKIKSSIDNKWGINNPRKFSNDNLELRSHPQNDAPIQQPTTSIIDPSSLDIKTDPTDCTDSVSFLLSTLVTKMRVRANQALALLSNSNKLLIHVIIKGLKGDYAPVLDWYKEIFTHSTKLLELLQSEPDGVNAVLQVFDIFKAGLFSKNIEICDWALRLLGKVSNELNSKGMSGLAWDWFIAENGGLQAVIYAIEKSRELAGENIISVLCQFGRYNFMELFTHNMKLIIPEADRYMKIIGDLMPSLADYKLSRDELANSGVISFLIDFACRKADIDNQNMLERTAALDLLLEIWLNFPNAVEEKDEYTDNIIKVLQRANRDKNSNIQIVSIVHLFKLLEVFAAERNPYAPVIYKSLTFALVENHNKENIREVCLSGFKQIFETFNSIPVSILMDPFIKQIRASDGVTYHINLFDFDFFDTIARHPKLMIKNAIQTMDLLAKPYIYNQIFSGCAFSVFMKIATRYKGNEIFTSFMQQLIRVFCDIL